jgi:nitrous oxidase accessory protein NosD
VALDMRRTSNRFDDGVRGNHWSENPAFDLDGDGISDAPYGPVGAFAFVSKQYPDLTILAKSPAVAALGVAERVLPALRPSEAVDRFPLVRPLVARGGAPAGLPRGMRRASWGGVAGFAALGLLGLAGIVRRERRVAR